MLTSIKPESEGIFCRIRSRLEHPEEQRFIISDIQVPYGLFVPDLVSHEVWPSQLVKKRLTRVRFDSAIAELDRGRFHPNRVHGEIGRFDDFMGKSILERSDYREDNGGVELGIEGVLSSSQGC